MSLLAALGLALAGLFPVQDSPAPALKGLDPVELTRGKEVAGDAKFVVDRAPHRYLFVSEENKQAFLADPERLGIQWGGACGRMGPGSGSGSPDRFWVHDGRIYVFASEACREGFKKDPASHLDPDEAPVEGDETALKSGRQWIERAVAAHGGAKAIDGMQRLQLLETWEVQGKDGPTQRVRELSFEFPDDVCLREAWGDWESKTVLRKSECFAWYTGGKTEDEHASARRDFERRLAREPLLILRARLRSDFRAVVLEPRATDASGTTRVAVSFANTRTELGLDARTGEIVSVLFRGRGAGTNYGPTRRFYRVGSESKGVRSPMLLVTEFGGQQSSGREKLQSRTEVDGTFPSGVFTRP